MGKPYELQRSKEFENLVQNTDWALLQRQKTTLFRVTTGDSLAGGVLSDWAQKDLNGIIHFLDAVQDAIVAAGFCDEKTVFRSNEEEEYSGVEIYRPYEDFMGRVDPKRCAASVITQYLHQCSRLRGHGPDGAFCQQHGKKAKKVGASNG